MTASAAQAALALPQPSEMFGLPECDVHLIAKLRIMPAELRDTIIPKEQP